MSFKNGICLPDILKRREVFEGLILDIMNDQTHLNEAKKESLHIPVITIPEEST